MHGGEGVGIGMQILGLKWIILTENRNILIQSTMTKNNDTEVEMILFEQYLNCSALNEIIKC